MCEACLSSLAAGRPSVALLARARAIEAALPGERVPREAWEIFAGHAGGAIEFRHYERLLRCRDAAAASHRARHFFSCAPDA